MAGEPYWIGLKPKSVYSPSGLLITLGFIAVALASLAAYWLSRQLLRPLTELRAAADRLNLSASPEPLREDGLDEIAGLSRSFNAMTERLRGIEANRALVLAGISHDLRSPLTKLRLGLEMADIDDRDLRESTIRQVDTIETVLSRFLQFARGFDAEPVETVALAGVFATLRADHADAGVQAEMPPLDVTFLARPVALRRALGNLVENALRYGRAPVRLAWRREGEALVISVIDQGEGFAEEDTELFLKPFVRGDAARQPDAAHMPGTGLGLAMVDQIVRLHGWRLAFNRSAVGFEATIMIPNRA
ncbi:risS protein [Asticcacaulis biprosthecium C19]|uniref:histidine kinase n=2 Tax=Asticcacaulis biprosthecium TaxID=76891 RepID=F4QGG9_9CAUL|nr:risS protein [Asticcacaulis biprosthecium C19]